MTSSWGYERSPNMVPVHTFTPDPLELDLCGKCGHHERYIKHVDSYEGQAQAMADLLAKRVQS